MWAGRSAIKAPAAKLRIKAAASPPYNHCMFTCRLRDRPGRDCSAERAKAGRTRVTAAMAVSPAAAYRFGGFW